MTDTPDGVGDGTSDPRADAAAESGTEESSVEDLSGADSADLDLDAELAELVDGVVRGNPADPFSIFGSGSVMPPASTYSSCEEALEDAVSSLERVTAERDEYLDLARRGQAEFENYRRRIDGQRVEQTQRAAESLVLELLPVLDACEAALAHGADDVSPIHNSLFGILQKQGLGPITDIDVAFDPTVHEAVLTEPADGNDAGPVVAEVLRTGYTWNGRVLRPAMVKVRG